MILNNIKNMKKAHGFTIVELLVVIVVIGILATITIVSYAGITQKANTTKAQTNAQSAQTIAEVYAAEENHYPELAASFALYAGSAKLPAGITVIPGADTTPLTSSNGLANVTWACLDACTGTTGGKITYWDFSTGAVSTTIIYVGAAKVGDTFVYPAT